MGLKDLKDKIHNSVRSFERRYETSIFFYPEDNPPVSIIEVRLVDQYHKMDLYMKIDLTNLQVADLAVEETRVPYSSCPNAIKNYSFILGQQISKLNRISSREDYQRVQGCLHINELIEEGSRSFYAAYGFFLKEYNYPVELNEEKMVFGDYPRETRREAARHWWMKDRRIKNSCFSFNSETEVADIKKLIEKVPTYTEMVLKNMKKGS